MTDIKKSGKRKNEKKAKKLQLHKETVKDLSASQNTIDKVKGGVGQGSYIHQTQVYPCN